MRGKKFAYNHYKGNWNSHEINEIGNTFLSAQFTQKKMRKKIPSSTRNQWTREVERENSSINCFSPFFHFFSFVRFLHACKILANFLFHWTAIVEKRKKLTHSEYAARRWKILFSLYESNSAYMLACEALYCCKWV